MEWSLLTFWTGSVSVSTTDVIIPVFAGFRDAGFGSSVGILPSLEPIRGYDTCDQNLILNPGSDHVMQGRRKAGGKRCGEVGARAAEQGGEGVQGQDGVLRRHVHP